MRARAPALIRVAPWPGGPSVCLLDLRVIPDPDATAAGWLTRLELAEFVRFRHWARRREWLGARMCVKAMAIEAGLAGHPRECAVVKDARGVPWLVAGGFTRACSLAHDSRFAAAGLSPRAGTVIGIDVERISPRVLRLAPAFVRDGEWLPTGTRSAGQAARLWALKEAAAKAAGGGLGVALAATVAQSARGAHAITVDQTRTLAGWHAVHSGHVVAACASVARDEDEDEDLCPRQHES
jgi:phosphopantetheinyl transferase